MRMPDGMDITLFGLGAIYQVFRDAIQPAKQGHNMVDMEPAVCAGKHKKTNPRGNAEDRENTSGMVVVYLHCCCLEIKKICRKF